MGEVAGRRCTLEGILLGLLAVLLLYAHPAVRAVSTGPAGPDRALDAAIFDPATTSPVLGLLVFGGMLFGRRARIAQAFSAPALGWVAWPALSLGVALLGWSRAIGASDLEQVAWVFELIGFAALLGGRPLLRQVGYPLLALVAVIPPPAIVINQLVFPLQRLSAEWASMLLRAVGHVHRVAGDFIVTPGITFQVVEGCSGLKTSLSLILAAVAYGELVGGTRRERLILLAVAPLIGFLVNGPRVVALVLGEVREDSFAHQAYGLLAIVAAVVVLAGVEVLLSRRVFRNVRRDEASAAADARAGFEPPAIVAKDSRALRGRWIWALGTGVLVAGGTALSLPGRLPPHPYRFVQIEALPTEIAGRVALSTTGDEEFLGTVRFAHQFHRVYQTAGAPEIRVFVGIADPERRDVSALSPKTAIPRSGWTSIERRAGTPALYAPGVESDALRIRYPADATSGGRGGEVLVEHFRIGFAPWEIEFARAWLGLDRMGPPATAGALVVRVETDATGNDAADELRLRQFAQEVSNWYRTGGEFR